jgi:Do/DeqQ family serine protease
MDIMKRLFSKKLFIANLVLLGMMAGFAVAIGIFVAGNLHSSGNSLGAESPVAVSPDAQSSLAEAEKVQGAFRYVSKQLLPVVTEIKIEEEVAPSDSQSDNFPWKFFFDNQDNPNTPVPKAPRLQKGLGSGVIVERKDDTYFVLTNNHVAGSAKSITIVLYDKREFNGTLVGADKRHDLAVVSFTSKDKDIPIARLGDSDKVEVGDWAIAVGNPLGLDFSVTTGTISALQRSGGPEDNISDFIQTDASINQGNSGGALSNIRGEVIGINTWIASPSGGSIGLGFAIPINTAKRTVRDLIDHKEVKYGWLGVVLSSDLDDASFKSLGIDAKKGAFAEQVVLGSPADKSGIKAGDFITSVDGKAITDATQLTRVVGDIPAGNTSVFKLLRGGKDMTVNVKIEARDEKKVADNTKVFPGIVVLPSDSEALDGEDIPAAKKGVVVAAVRPKSPAVGMGLAARDVITAVNGKAVKSLKDFYIALADAGSKLNFTYIRGDQEFETPSYIKK